MSYLESGKFVDVNPAFGLLEILTTPQIVIISPSSESDSLTILRKDKVRKTIGTEEVEIVITRPVNIIEADLDAIEEKILGGLKEAESGSPLAIANTNYLRLRDAFRLVHEA